MTSLTVNGLTLGNSTTSTPVSHARFWTDIYDDHGHLVKVAPEPTDNQPLSAFHPDRATGPRTLYFDLEISKSLEECGGSWDRVRQEGGVSILCIWDETEARPYFFDSHTLDEAAEKLCSADVVVSFNGRWFDVPLLENHFARTLAIKEHLDLFVLVKAALARDNKSWKGHGLDALATNTLGRGKTGHGSHAPALARDGKWGQLVNYCLEDVLLTRDLGRFVAQNRFVIDRDGEKLALDVPEWYTLVS